MALILRHFLCTHVIDGFVSKSVCMELQQWLNWGMGYEFTLDGWMLRKIINKLVGRRNTVVSEIAMTTHYILNMAQANLGRIEGRIGQTS